MPPCKMILNAMTLTEMTLGKKINRMTLDIMPFSRVTLGRMTPSRITFGIKTFSRMTLDIMPFMLIILDIMTLKCNDTHLNESWQKEIQHDNT